MRPVVLDRVLDFVAPGPAEAGHYVSTMSIADDDYRRLISLIAHELRSPGAVVVGYLRLLARNTATSLAEPERKMIEEANKSCGRLLHIAQELSELSDLSNGDSIRAGLPVQIFSLCDEVVRAAADGGGAVSLSIDDRDKGACVEGDAARLRQAISLLVNVIARERGTTPMTVTGAISRETESRAVLRS